MENIYYLERLFPNNSFYSDDKIMIKRIVKAIHCNEDLDIRNIAKINYTSASSISRLVKRAGFNNYKELIFFLSQNTSNSLNNKIEGLSFATTINGWEKIDDLFNRAFYDKKIYLFGEGFCQTIVNYTYRKLLLKKIYAINLDGVEISMVTDETPHTLITFSQSGENKHGLIKIKECRDYGGHAVTITSNKNSSYAKIGDIVFIVEEKNSSYGSENKHLNYFFGNCLNLMEYLIDRYTNC